MSQNQLNLTSESPKKETVKYRLESLRRQVVYHQDLYYNQNTTEISDAEFDKIWHEIKHLESLYPNLITDSSPTQRVSIQSRSRLAKKKHNLAMLSLDNIFNKEQLQNFVDKIKDRLGELSGVSFACEAKVDGLSLSLIYKQGDLISAITRGDGSEGEEVGHNIKTIPTIPQCITSTLEYVEVRGEVYISKSDFININKKYLKTGQKQLANARNAASGTLRMLDSSQVQERVLSFIGYGIYDESGLFMDHLTSLQQLKVWGFATQDHAIEAFSVDECQSAYEKILSQREAFPFEIDGVVIKVNQRTMQVALGEAIRTPRWMIAYKFPAISVNSKVESVDFQVGRTGILTPVARLKPVILGGVTVKNATLHNRDEIHRLGLLVGDTVEVVRAGDVIPKIIKVISENRNGDEREICEPKLCPCCGTALLLKDDLGEGSNFYCPVGNSCKEQLLYSLMHFCSRGAMNVVGLGKQLLEKLIGLKKIQDFSDIFLLNQADLLLLPKVKENLANKIIRSINSSRAVALERLVFALGINGVGKSNSRSLAQYFGNIDSLRICSSEMLMEVPDIGPNVARSITEFFADKDNCSMLDKLIAQLDIEAIQNIEKNDYFLDKSVVITGILKLPREFYVQKLLLAGAKVGSSISKKTDLVLAGENAGTKLDKAINLGIKIISEQDVRQLLAID